MIARDVIYAVHAVRPDEITATALLSASLPAAEVYAAELSTDPGVLAGAVTRFVLDSPGTRTAVSLFAGGKRQDAPYISNDRQVLANGHGPRRTRIAPPHEAAPSGGPPVRNHLNISATACKMSEAGRRAWQRR